MRSQKARGYAWVPCSFGPPLLRSNRMHESGYQAITSSNLWVHCVRVLRCTLDTHSSAHCACGSFWCCQLSPTCGADDQLHECAIEDWTYATAALESRRYWHARTFTFNFIYAYLAQALNMLLRCQFPNKTVRFKLRCPRSPIHLS